jgi:LruC domain-containing protein
MNHTRILIKAVLCTMIILLAVACKRDLYDEEQYRNYIKYMSPVDSVDQRHEWKLTVYKQYGVKADAAANIKKCMLLDANPLTTRTANVLNQVGISDGETLWLAASVPYTLTTIYAALVDENGRYYVTSFPASQTDVISFSSANSGIPTNLTLNPQTYTYCYEKDIPLVDDFDYNDLVFRLGISKDPEQPTQVTFHLTLIAVGCTNQIAAFIRIPNCNISDITDITTADGKTFNDELPEGSKQLVDNTDLLQADQKNTDAVICLFADAHWAMDNTLKTSPNAGTISRKNYNVKMDYNLDEMDKYDVKAYRKQNYVITFKNAQMANDITLEDIDPFIVTIYNSARFETHLDRYKTAQTLYDYKLELKIKDLPWALMVPSENFWHPLEGVQIGFRKHTSSGVAFNDGAYTDFGEWVENCNAYLDWYKYPNENLIWEF